MKKTIYTIMMLLMCAAGATAETADKTIIITSDWHLSDSRSFDKDCYYAWCDKNKDYLAEYINNLTEKKDEWDVLVLNGDIFEFWRSPVDKYMVADEKGNILTDIQYLLRIKENNADIIAALERLHAAGKEIVYMPGNHDLSVSADDIEQAFPGLFTCAFDTDGTGIYEPFGDNTAVAIEHGNRYEYFNAPYQHGVFGSSYAESTSLLPPGFFTSKLGASATVYKATLNNAKASLQQTSLSEASDSETDADNRTYVTSIWNAIRAGVGSPGFDVKTCIDGIGTADHNVSGWKEYAVSETNSPVLFKDSWTIANWKKRCELNKVPVYIPLSTSLLSATFHDIFDDVAFTERLCNQQLPTLICVFGHSHVKVLQTRRDAAKGDVVYLNEGAWVDDAGVRSYGVIRYKADKHQYAIELRRYDGTADTMIDCRYLTVPENNATRLADGTWLFNAKAVVSDSETSGIEQIEDGEWKMENGECYNLNGQRLCCPTKGINIINGKKVVVKKPLTLPSTVGRAG